MSQAQLANLPPVYGLYTSIIPTITYAFFGSSMILTLGPTAVISLLTGALLTKYGADYETDLDYALDTAAQASFCVGLIITIIGLVNLGSLIHFIAEPVMTGFVTGCAFVIGITQIKAATGFLRSPPTVGAYFDGHLVEDYYEVMTWWKDNWNDEDNKGNSLQNPIAIHVSEFFLSYY